MDIYYLLIYSKKYSNQNGNFKSNVLLQEGASAWGSTTDFNFCFLFTLALTGIRSPARPARNKSLYQLSYPEPF
jgi:hypothetical protein